MQREHSFKNKLQIAICSYLQAWSICIWDDRKTNQDCTEIYPDNSNSPLKLELFFVSLKSSSSPPGFYCSHEQVCLNAMYYKYFSFQLIILFSVWELK